MAADDKQDRERLLGIIEDLHVENTALADRAMAAEAKDARFEGCLAKVGNQLDRFRAEEFWDRVMRRSPKSWLNEAP